MENQNQTPQNNASGQPSQTDIILGRPADQAPKDIVSTVAPDRIDPALRPRYQQLLQIRDDLIDQENSLQAQGEEVQPKDRQQADAESATVINLRDMAFARAMTYNELIEEVNEALSRIEQGTYGRCELTGKPIPADRLGAIPWTRFTAEAEAQLEREGQAPAQFRLPEAGRLKGSSETIELSGDETSAQNADNAEKRSTDPTDSTD
jgi:RNA polymerase-binding transcription factor DksA